MKVITPGYPGIKQSVEGVEALRKDPSPLSNLGVGEIFDHLAKIIGGYDRYAVPVSGRLLFQACFANFAPNSPLTCNLGNDKRAPLLFISGGNDHAVPTAIQRENYKKAAKRSAATTAYKLFPGRDHFTRGEKGWEAVADFAVDWALTPTEGNLG